MSEKIVLTDLELKSVRLLELMESNVTLEEALEDINKQGKKITMDEMMTLISLLPDVSYLYEGQTFSKTKKTKSRRKKNKAARKARKRK